MFDKVKSVNVSKRVFNYVKESLEILVEDGANISGYLQTFASGREQGYYLTIYDRKFKKKDIIFWAYENRSSDDIMVAESLNRPDMSGMFDEEAYKNKKQFAYREEARAAEYIVKRIKEYFEI